MQNEQSMNTLPPAFYVNYIAFLYVNYIKDAANLQKKKTTTTITSTVFRKYNFTFWITTK